MVLTLTGCPTTKDHLERFLPEGLLLDRGQPTNGGLQNLPLKGC